ILRGARRGPSALRVELSQAAAAHQARGEHHAHPPGEGGHDLLRALPDSSSAPAGNQPGRQTAGAAHRRGRPRRRGVRGLSPGGALGVPGDDPRDRHREGDPSPVRHPDLEWGRRAAGRLAPGAPPPPSVSLTSNRVRELSDALRRRCLYLWIDFPGFEKEVRIVMRKVPGVNEALARQISRFMESLRPVRLAKVPGVAETLDWAQALSSLHADHLDDELVLETLGCVLKDADDVKRFKRELTASGLKRFVTPVDSKAG